MLKLCDVLQALSPSIHYDTHGAPHQSQVIVAIFLVVTNMS